MSDVIGYVALGLLAAMAVLAFVTACACVGLYFKFHDGSGEGWRETFVGDAEKGS